MLEQGLPASFFALVKLKKKTLQKTSFIYGIEPPTPVKLLIWNQDHDKKIPLCDPDPVKD